VRQEAAEKIMMCLAGRGIDDPDIMQDIIIVLSEYEVTPRETSVAVRSEDKNKYFMQKFIVAKTVKGCTDRTVQAYRKEVWKILLDIGKPADEITADDIRLYLALRQKRDKVSKRTVGNELRYISSFFSYLHTEELIPRNPVAKIDRIKYDKPKKSAFTEMDVEKIRSACLNAREAAIIELFLSTGCRVSELAMVLLADIKGDKLIVHGKGQKDRTVYLNVKAQMALQLYISERNDKNPYLFPRGISVTKTSIYGNPALWYKNPEYVETDGHTDKCSIESIVRKIGKRAGVEKCHPHRFRRTCATFALRRGMPIEQVSKMLGHESIETTQIYLDLSEEELEQAHRKYVV